MIVVTLSRGTNLNKNTEIEKFYLESHDTNAQKRDERTRNKTRCKVLAIAISTTFFVFVRQSDPLLELNKFPFYLNFLCQCYRRILFITFIRIHYFLTKM